MDVEDFVEEWRVKHDIYDEWSWMDVVRCVTAAIAQDREEQRRQHCHERAGAIEDAYQEGKRGDLAAKLEQLKELSFSPVYLICGKGRRWFVEWSPTPPHFKTTDSFDTSLAAVDAALEEGKGKTLMQVFKEEEEKNEDNKP
jgi:hypothetical protein